MKETRRTRLRRFWLHHSLDVVGTSILVTFIAVVLTPFYLRSAFIF